MNNRYLAVLCLVVLSILAMGCKHGSVLTSTNIAQKARTSPRIGDKAVYTAKNVAPKIPIIGGESTGQRTDTIINSGKHRRSLPSYITGTFDLKEDSIQRVGLSQKRHTVITWFGEDADGNLYLLGDSFDGKPWDIVTNPDPPMYLPSKMKVGTWWKCIANFNGGNTESIIFQCLGKESVSTPLGNLDAYKINVDYSDTRLQTKMTGSMWMPQNLPAVFALKESYNVTNSLLTIGMSYDLERIELAE